jgi:16S rRNA (guanine527-N7)-methyltransferase
LILSQIILKDLLENQNLGLEKAQISSVLAFYELLSKENEVQNLTRLIGPSDFIEGHLLDTLELIRSGLVDFPAMDLGSGGGVPGLLAAVIRPDHWVLVESEKRKAEFLARAVSTLKLEERVSVAGIRAEDYLKQSAVESIVARAVGPVDRIYGWIRKCSTWNTLVLLKGPSWEEEWARFQASKFKSEIAIEAIHSYEVGPDNKKRMIVRLTRKK